MQRERSNGKAIGERQMSGLRNLTTRMAMGTKALVAVVLMGGVLTIATAATVHAGGRLLVDARRGSPPAVRPRPLDLR